MRFRLALCAAAIAGVKAIREVDPEARMVHIDPLVLVVPPAGPTGPGRRGARTRRSTTPSTPGT